MADKEVVLADIWKKLLEIETFSKEDDFFRLGGNSIKAIKLVSKIKKAFCINFTLKQVFQNSTFNDMLNDISESR